MVALQLVATELPRTRKNPRRFYAGIRDSYCLYTQPKVHKLRISEMVKAGHVYHDEKEQSKYRITTSGIHWLNSTIAKKIRPPQ